MLESLDPKLVALPKLSPGDVAVSPELQELAHSVIRTYSGFAAHVLAARGRLDADHGLSPRELVGVLNFATNEARQKEAKRLRQLKGSTSR